MTLSLRVAIALSLLCALAFSAALVLAQDEQPPTATIERTADGYSVPETLPEGVVALSLGNAGEMPAALVLARLNEGVTEESFMETMSEAGPDAVVDLVTIVGGTDVAPGGTSNVTVSLQPGTYVVLDFNAENPLAGTFTVADMEGEGAAAPEADVEVTFLDFAFTMPLSVPAGENVWHVTNAGEQWHEMAVFRIEDDATIAEYTELLARAAAGEEPREGDPAAEEPSAVIYPLSSDEELWVTVDLEPGRYVILCPLPDFVSGHPHFTLGMVNILTVS